MQSLTDEAIKRAQENSNVCWLLAAERGLRILARQKQTLTADDLWDWLRTLPDLPDTKDHRAMGSVFRNAYRDHIIVPINQWQESRRPSAHRRPIRVWKSLLIM